MPTTNGTNTIKNIESNEMYRPRVELYNPKYTTPEGTNILVPELSRYRRTPGDLIDNYIYFYHLPSDTDSNSVGRFAILPSYPDQFQDRLESTFASESILARSAPIFAYSNSGPRQVGIDLKLHRDLMQQLNLGVSNLNVELGDDYVTTLINMLQAVALPKYDYGSKMINPPMVAIRFGNEIFIKGIVTGGITTTSSLPLLSNGKYAQVSVNFNVSEVDPYDAESVVNYGQLRGVNTTLERNLYK